MAAESIDVLVVAAGSEYPRPSGPSRQSPSGAGPRRHSHAQAEDLHVGTQQATAVTRVPANGITTTNISPPETTELTKFAIAVAAQLYPVPQAASYRLHLTAEGYQSGDLLDATFIDQYQGLTRPLVSSSCEGKGGRRGTWQRRLGRETGAGGRRLLCFPGLRGLLLGLRG